MKCCKKFVAIAVLVALGIFTVSALKHGWWRVVKEHGSGVFKSNVPTEVQLERVKGLIKDLDGEIAKGWTPIATRELDIKNLKKDVEVRTSNLERVRAEMQFAAKALEDKVQRISYNNKDQTPAQVRKALGRDLAAYKGLSRELEANTKLLAAWERDLDAMKANQDEMRNKKAELETQVAQIEADLKVLKLAETKSNMPVGDRSKLDEIKATLAELEKDNAIRMRAMELRDAHDRGENISGSSIDSDDDLIKRVKAVTGGEKNPDDIGK